MSRYTKPTMDRARGPARELALLVAAAMVISAPGCKTTKPDDATQAEPAARTREQAASQKPADNGFDVFIIQLRGAVADRNIPLVASLMTPNFGYQLNPPKEGEGVFEFWDQNNLWGELSLVLQEEFVPTGAYMVAPPQFAGAQSAYLGYRAGIVRTRKGWKFAYFVKD